MDNKSCSTGNTCAKSGCMKYMIVAFIAAFAALFGMDYVFHGVMMMPAYQATASLWRPEADMQNYCYISMIRQAVTAGVFVCLITCICKGVCDGACRMGKGIKTGLKLGVLLGITNFGAYAYLPIPMDMAVKWLGIGIIEGVILGAIIGLIYKKMKGDGACKTGA